MIPPYVKILLLTSLLVIKVNTATFWYVNNGSKTPINGEVKIQLVDNDYQLVIGIE